MARLRDQGLYETQYEHDACGIGAVVNINGTRDHSILEYGKQILINQGTAYSIRDRNK